MDLGPEQYVFDDHFKTFDPNMCSAAEFSPPLPASVNNDSNETTIASFQAIPSNYNELTGHSDISLVPMTETSSNNCITYNNIIFVPSIANNGNQLDSIGDGIEMVKHESNVSGIELNDTQSIKYIVTSDSNLLNTFIQPNDLNGAVLTNNEEYIEQQPTHMVPTDGQIDNNLVLNETNDIQRQLNDQIHHDMESMLENQIAIQQIHTANDQEIFMEDENGQLYRQVQSILIGGTSICPNELLPILSANVDLADPDYVEQSISRIQAHGLVQSAFNQREHTLHDMPFQIPVNFIANAESNKTMDSGLDMQHVEFILNSENRSEINGSNEYGTQANVNILNDNTNYQAQTALHTNDSTNQQSNFLDCAMSTLCT